MSHEAPEVRRPVERRGGEAPVAGAPPIEQGLFFIVGAPRSGTTLLQAVLASLPAIVIPPETEFFMKFEPPPEAATDDGAWRGYLGRFFASTAWRDQGLDEAVFAARAGATDRSARAVFLALLAMHAGRAGKARVGEKSPHHCRHVERLARLFPGAKFIHIHRDPRDVVASQMRVPWSRGDSHFNRARAWAKVMREHERLLAVMTPERYTAVRYETLVEQLEEEARRLCAFLGEPFDPAALRFHERADAGFASRENEWKGGTLRPLSAASVAAYRERLSARQIAGIERSVGPLLRRFGYEPEPRCPSFAWPLLDARDRVSDQLRRLARSAGRRAGASARPENAGAARA